MGYIEDMRNLVGNHPLILIGSHAIILNENNEILLQLRTDFNRWGIIGGALEYNETLEDALKREVYEETGLIIKTGLTSIVTGLLFFASLFALPFVKLIPDSAIAPILIIIGGLMITSIQQIPLNDFSEGFPAFLIIVMIPLTYSIADGIAFGFIAYPILKVALGKRKEVAPSMYIITCLFLAMFVLHAIG